MKQAFFIVATFFSTAISAQTKTVTMAPTASTGSRATFVAESTSKEKPAISFEYLTITANIEKDGQLSIPEARSQESKEEAIKTLKQKMNNSSSKEEQEKLMKRYEKISSGEYSLDEKLNDLGADGYELVSAVNTTHEDIRQIRFFLNQSISKK